jgi:hypothetical protein
MPIALDSNETVDVVLKLEEHLPEGQRPSFTCRYMTCRQTIQYQKALEKAYEEKDDAKASALLDDALLIAVVGWKNIAVAFSKDTFDDVLTPAEKWELASKIPASVRLTELDKKKLLWQQQSVAAKFAPSAGRKMC